MRSRRLPLFTNEIKFPCRGRGANRTNVSPSGQSNLIQGRIAAAPGSLSRIRQVAPMFLRARAAAARYVTSVDVCVAFGRAVSDNDGFCGITGATPQCPVGIKHDGLDGNIRYSTSSLLLFSTTAIYIARKMSHMHYTQQRCKISSDLTILPVCVCQVC